MKIQPQLFITPKNNTPNHSQVKSEAAEPISNKLYNPIYYRDYNISFGARLFRTPANFYAQPFNQTGMPQTMKTYLNDDYEDRQNMPPAQMMKIVFEPLKYADNLEEVKELFPDEPLFENLSSTPTRKARTGVLAEIDLMKDENSMLFKNTDDTLGMYLLKKIYLEGKSLKEINKDFQNDISSEFNGLSPIDYTTMSAYGIKMPNQGFWKSFLATREDFPYEYKPRKEYRRTVDAANQKQEKELSLESIKKHAEQKPVKGKFDTVKDWEIDKLADAMITGKGNEEETRRILKKKNLQNSESSNFVMKYMWAIMPIVLEKTNASAEMKNFWATYDTGNKSQKDIMSAYWRTTPQMQALQSLMMKDTIKLFMEAYGVDGNNEEFQQLLKYPAEIAERRKQFDKAHDLKQKEYDEMFAELDRQEQLQLQNVSEIPEENPPVSEEIADPDRFGHITFDTATGDLTISETIEKRYNQKIFNSLDIYPAQLRNKYLAFFNNHPLVTNEYKLVTVLGNNENIRAIFPDIMTVDEVKAVTGVIDKDFTNAEPVLVNNLRQAFIDALGEFKVENVQNIYWEDNFGDLREGIELIPDDMKAKFKAVLNRKYDSYKQPLTISETLKITNAFLQLLVNTKADEISSKNEYMHDAFMIVHDSLAQSPQIRKKLKEFMQQSNIIAKQGGNMRALLDPNVPDKIKKEKAINLITTNETLAAYITKYVMSLANTDPEIYFKLKQLKAAVDPDKK